MGDNLLKNIGVDISTLPVQSVKVLVGCEPKVKCINKFLQRIFTRVFGLKPVYETKQAKVITVKAEGYIKVSQYMKENSDQLLKESEE